MLNRGEFPPRLTLTLILTLLGGNFPPRSGEARAVLPLVREGGARGG